MEDEMYGEVYFLQFVNAGRLLTLVDNSYLCNQNINFSNEL